MNKKGIRLVEEQNRLISASVSITQDLKGWLEEEFKLGRWSSQSEIIRFALHRLRKNIADGEFRCHTAKNKYYRKETEKT